MLGVLLVLTAMSSLAGASYKIGAVATVPSTEDTQQQYNVSLVVAAVAFMMALCGILMATTGWNPFGSLGNMTMSKGSAGSGGMAGLL